MIHEKTLMIPRVHSEHKFSIEYCDFYFSWTEVWCRPHDVDDICLYFGSIAWGIRFVEKDSPERECSSSSLIFQCFEWGTALGSHDHLVLCGLGIYPIEIFPSEPVDTIGTCSTGHESLYCWTFLDICLRSGEAFASEYSQSDTCDGAFVDDISGSLIYG